jgi:pimeloyl-ACP methyl ester carboxylesterase
VAALRIDQSGKGDSERREGMSFLESVRRDFEEAAAFLRATTGAEKFIVVGLCSGAHDAFYLASEYAEIAGVVQLDGYARRTVRYYVRHYGPRLLRWRSWSGFVGRVHRRILGRPVAAGAATSQEGSTDLGAFQEALRHDDIRRRYRSILDRKVKLLCVFTAGAEDYYNYEGQLIECLQLQTGAEGLTEMMISAAEHTFPLSVHRDRLMDEICSWSEAVLEGACSGEETIRDGLRHAVS